MSIQLSEQQKKIVDYNGKYLAVIAGAGSGKTRVLTERIIKLCSTLKTGEKVLAITFSNKASEELRERLIQSIGEKELNEQAYIGTIHQFCLDLVISRGNLIGLPDELHICESYNDRLQMLRETVEVNPAFKSDFFGDDSKNNQKILRELLDEISITKRNLDDYSDINNRNKIILFEEYDEKLLQQGVMDFDDILKYAHKILVMRESVVRIFRRIYKYLCIDEAQDLNKAQYEIIKILAGGEIGITVVGDPKQSIYGFNGSTSEYLESTFRNEYNAEVVELSENYRSSQKVIKAANIIEDKFDSVGVYPIVGEFEIHCFNNSTDEANYIYERIKKLLANGHSDIENQIITPNQCAVIARNRYVFSHLENILKDNKVEYALKVSAKGSFSSESDLMKAFELGIRLLVNNKDKLHLKELSKLLKTNFNDFAQARKASYSDYWRSKITALDDAWSQLEITENDIRFDKSIEKIKFYLKNNAEEFEEHDLSLINGDINAWLNNWNGYIRNSSPKSRTLANFVRIVSLGTMYTPDDKGIVLSTVHMSKGLEYDVVFVMGLNEGVFPDYRAVTAFNNNDEKPLIEERHNMFVAITRSKRLCYLTYPLTKGTDYGIKQQKSSRFVEKFKGVFDTVIHS